MLERRRELEPERAEQLERVLNGLFEKAIGSGLGRAKGDEGLSMSEIVDRRMGDAQRHELDVTPVEALIRYLDGRAVHHSSQIKIAAVFGELYGVGDVSGIENQLGRSGFLPGQIRSVVQRVK